MLNEDYFFSLLFGELSGMVGSNSSDAVYDALQSRLKRIVQDVFQGDQIPDIWKNTAEEYLRALTPDRVKEQCRVIQNSCADLIRKLINQENNWGAGLVLLVPPVNFTAFVRERFRLHAGDMSEMNRQLIGFLEEYRRNPAAVREFQQDYGNATAGGIAFQTDPPNPFITDSPAEHAPQHVPVQKDTFKLHRWYADSLNDMRP